MPKSDRGLTRAKGRPSEYSAEVAAAICEQLASGQTLRAVCRDPLMPAESTVRAWALDDREGFSAQYARAREIGYHTMADEALEIADDNTNDTVLSDVGERPNSEWIARSRLRVDTRKWLLSKALPKVYGDKVLNEHTGKDGGPITFASLLQEIDGSSRGLPADQDSSR